jgi:7,8-didemethyl-8-hydroxy-5-deazariboflavin synthase
MTKIITYSKAYTLVPTYECFNRCTYCNFRVDPGQDSWLTLPEAKTKLTQLQSQNITEILILSGEVHPNSKLRKPWFRLIYNLCELALEMGFLPHTNVGPLSYQEMSQLKQVNVSMGLMLEQLTPTLLNTVHLHAPSKNPPLRLQQIEQAGQLKIPFTTGILLGIGETEQNCWESLRAIASLHLKYGHIQEVILQPHSLGSQQALQSSSFNLKELPRIIAKASQILPDTITIQIPPNLIPQTQILLDCLAAGATDLGGISPIDEVNPDFEHLTLENLSNLLKNAGYDLVQRLPVYPPYYRWLGDRLQFLLRGKNCQSTNT